ncbi:uncharacterized protein UV8b_04301 [Ustilaginoidea virens]|uniref:Nitrogen regulatory protein areA GATA-like domain-containing protein n=1 Tax=Ustilaginoidea virens TaxID=1159556 RepID=A0A8E5HR03_USTVR|nr:uncharacterized protein UV8b_04301 [Ustilaginoidea virens]QUC20060.1 hypothetical protein UV8b_04301 [Ustilaginoidea virens]
MDSGVPMILPKGIVINNSSIYKEVASFSIVPADKIWEYWHVYTVTNKKLKDPTARRLENFWWQVWGSDRKYLSGAALARIYEDISVGPTILPLQGPPNRWEGPHVPPLTRQMVVARYNEGCATSQQRPEPPRTKTNQASIKHLSSSASKPPPAHPILKKARSPLAHGPKPTARFASPLGSENDGAEDDDTPSSGSIPTTGSEAPTKSTKSPATSQKLPGTSIPENAEPTTDTRRAPAQLGAVPPAPERCRDHAGQQRRGTEGSMPRRAPVKPALGAKATGKQPKVARIATSHHVLAVSRSSSRPTSSTPAVANASARCAIDTQSSPTSAQTSLGARAGTDKATATESAVGDSSPIHLSMSQNGYARRCSSQGLFTGPTAMTTTVAAKGHIIDQAGSIPASTVLGSHMEGDGLACRPSAAPLADFRMAPTQPSQAASVPMGRTRSQLTLLLEREKSRVRVKPNARS